MKEQAMSQTPKKRKTKRRLTVETMETRLMLSVSPTGPVDVKDLTDVAIVPPPTQGARQLDVIDFADMAAQFNDAQFDEVQLQQQIGNAVSMRQLPDADTGALELSDPATFLSASTSSTDKTTSSSSERLSSEYASIAWTASSQAAGSTDQEAPRFEMPPLSLPGEDASMFESTSPEKAYFADPVAKPFHAIIDGDRAEKSPEDDFTQFDRGPLGTELDSWLDSEFNTNPGDFGDDSLFVYANDQGMISFDTMRQMDMVDIEGLFMNHDSDPNVITSLLNGLAVNDADSVWTAALQSDDTLNFNPGHPQGTPQTPPMPHAPGALDAFLATADTLYQSDSDSSGMENDATSRQTLNSLYLTSQNTLYSLQNADKEEGTYEKNTSLSELGGGGGTTSENDAVKLTFLENETDLKSDDLEIEGIMSTSTQIFMVDANTNTDEEGGIIDFTNAMSWSQKPVKATAEGIVEASVQQDNQVAFEGSYGQGQTFELATADETEATSPEPTTPENVSASLLEKLNNLPLDNKARENLDKTDLTPTAHEMALQEMDEELDYASLLPSDALSWATFAMVGQTAVRHPQDQKKKKDKNADPQNQ